MPGALEGKVCLVTGASRGIGKGIALQLGQNGAIVYITGKFYLFYLFIYFIYLYILFIYL